jgi:4-hydroxy-tetrahydrodipicolinate synthase
MEFILQGGQGVISVTANVAPKAMHDMSMLALAGDRNGAEMIDKRLAGLHQELFIEANPIPVKWALAQMGLIQAGIRLPLTWLSESCHAHVKQAMVQAGL